MLREAPRGAQRALGIGSRLMPQPGKQWWHVIISTYASWLPGDLRGFRSKAQGSFMAIRKELPGRVWALRGKFERVNTEGHHRNTYEYILRQENAWVWSFK